MIIEINPIQILETEITHVEIYTLPYQLDGNGVSVYYRFLNTPTEISGNIHLTPDEISNWGVDDFIIIELVLEKLQLTILKNI